MVTASSGSSIAGSVYSLVCTVTVVDGLVLVPDVMWMKDGRIFVNGTDTTLTRNVSGYLNLTFNPLRTSHGGQYTCIVTVSIQQVLLLSSNSTLVNIFVGSKCIHDISHWYLKITFPQFHHQI